MEQGACQVAGLIPIQVFLQGICRFSVCLCWFCLLQSKEGLRFSVHNPERRIISDGLHRRMDGWMGEPTFSFLLDFSFLLSFVAAPLGPSVYCFSVLQVLLSYLQLKLSACLQLLILFALDWSLTGSSACVESSRANHPAGELCCYTKWPQSRHLPV